MSTRYPNGGPLALLKVACDEPGDLTPLARHLALVLVLKSDNMTGVCRASLRRLAKITGHHRTTITRAIDELETAGWIIRERRTRPATDVITIAWCGYGPPPPASGRAAAQAAAGGEG